MIIELIYGAIRLAIPLTCIALAGMWLARTGVINIALDGQIALSAIAYVIGVSTGYWIVGLVLAIFAAWLIGAVLVYCKDKHNMDDLLIGLGLLYFCYGFSQVISNFVFDNPGYAVLGDENIGQKFSYCLAVIIAIIAILSEKFVTQVRLSKVIAESNQLTFLQGISTLRTRHIHNIVAALLLAVASICLVEHGGSFTNQISGQRGFLALAIIMIVNHSGLYTFMWAIGFAIGQKLVYTMPLPNEIMESFPYVIAILVLIVHNKQVAHLRDKIKLENYDQRI